MGVQVLLLKGTEGFGDRLQCLLMAIRYVKKTYRLLCVDWRDYMWAHNTKEDFHYYFDLVNIPCMHISQLESYFPKEIDENTVYPSSSAKAIRVINFNNYHKDFKNEEMNQVTRGEKDEFTEDIVVHPGVGLREFRYMDMMNIRIKDNIWAKIRLMIGYLGIPLVTNQYNVVHMRGGDHPQLKDINVIDYVKELYNKYSELSDNDRAMPLILISDTPELIQLWRSHTDAGVSFNNIPSISQKTKDYQLHAGLHKLKKGEMVNGLTKVDLNIQMLRDFVLMVNARHVIADGKSVFSKMATNIKKSTNFAWSPLNRF